MNVLLVGGGGREHALAWRLRQDDPNTKIFAAPGNPGSGVCASARAKTCSEFATTASPETAASKKLLRLISNLSINHQFSWNPGVAIAR